jgi:hypothetical protein
MVGSTARATPAVEPVGANATEVNAFKGPLMDALDLDEATGAALPNDAALTDA